MFGEHISISQALFVTLLSMGTVFVILAVIAFLLGYFEHLFSGRKKETAPVDTVAAPAETVAEETEPEEDPALVAVITAAILASQTASYPIRISRIRRVRESQSNWQHQAIE